MLHFQYLKEGGRLLPNRCTMSLVAVSDPQGHEDNVTFWGDVYGYRMSCMLQPSLTEASVEVVKPECVVSAACLIHDLDMETCEVDATEFRSDFSLEVINNLLGESV